MSTGVRGYYSLIQYCPNRSRLESANVGVVLFSPAMNFLDVVLAKGNDRLRRFFRGENLDLAAVDAAKRAIFYRFRLERDSFKSLDDFDRFISTRANALILTPARPVKVFEPQKDLRDLFDELVGGRAKLAQPSSAFREVDEIFRRPELRDRIQFDQQIRIPVIGRPFKVPYTYRNGALHLVKPVQFSANDTAATNTAMKLSVEGDLLERHGVDGAPAHLIVITDFSERVPEEVEQKVTDLFGEYNVRAVPLDRLPEFAEEIRQTAH